MVTRINQFLDNGEEADIVMGLYEKEPSIHQREKKVFHINESAASQEQSVPRRGQNGLW